MRVSKNVTINEVYKKGLEKMTKIEVGTELTLTLTNSTYGAGATSPYPFWHMKDKHVYVLEEYPSFYVIEVPGYIAETTLPSFKGSFDKSSGLFSVGTANYKYEPRCQTIDKTDIATGLFRVKNITKVDHDKFVMDEVERYKSAVARKVNN